MKKHILTLVIFSCSLATVFAQAPANGLVGYYSFTQSANNSVGTNNGVVSGATLTSDRFGTTNSAYVFDGLNDYIEIPTPFDLKPRTISFWFYATTIGSDERLYSSDNPSITAGMTQVGVSNNSGSDMINFFLGFSRASAPITKNEWHHVLMIVNQSTPNEIYLDCQKLTATIASADKSVNGLAKTIIGSSRNLNGYYFSGKIDELRVYDRALTTEEVTSLCEEKICYEHITVTDTLIINGAITNYKPITFKNTIKIYPNPSKDNITIDNGNFSVYAGYTIKITNSLSQTVFSSLINQQQFTIDLSTLTGNGVYFVHVIDNLSNTLDIRKIVLQ